MEQNIEKEKVNIAFNNILALIFMILGIIGTAFNTVLVLYSLFDGSPLEIVVVFMTFELFTLIMLFWGYKTRRLIRLFRKYVYVISSEHEGKLSKIAAILGKEESIVVKNLQKMIDKKYFANAYIDFRTQELMVAGQSLDKLKLSEAKKTKCQSCGGYSISVLGYANHCEYCGTLLK